MVKSGQSAPVALLMFNRPEITALVARRIREANPRALYLIADGPRPNQTDDVRACEETRRRVLELDWPCPVHTLFAESNMGLRNRVTTGLDWVFQHEPFAIVVEDDCLADPSFFPYATELLEKYQDDTRIGVVSGNNFLRGKTVSDDSYFFSRDVRIWGWGTWARVWTDFSHQGLDYQWSASEAENTLQALQSPARRRALLGDAERSHRINSWALPFVLHCLRRGYLNAVPRVNLVSNVGFGAQSTHTKFESFTAEVPASALRFPLAHPETVVDSPQAGQIETAQARWQWVRFPLTHPIDFVGRVARYFRLRLASTK